MKREIVPLHPLSVAMLSAAQRLQNKCKQFVVNTFSEGRNTTAFIAVAKP